MSTRRYLPWIPDEDENLTQLWERGLSSKAIARRMERTPGAVLKRVRRLNLSRRLDGTNIERLGLYLPPQLRRKIEEHAFQEGMSMGEYVRHLLIERLGG